MGRSPLWTAIRDTLQGEIAAGQYRAGDRLPTETRLAQRFGVNRHTIRRALADLAAAGVVHSRRGSGVFVAHTQTAYPLGRRVRFHQNLTAAGQAPRKQVLSLEHRNADAREAEALGISTEDKVHVYEGLSLADAVPIAVFRSVFSVARFPGMLDALAKTPSVTAALKAQGVADYTRVSTEITAKPASPTVASHLRIAVGDPILRTVSINADPDGQPVEYGRTWFAADRVAFTIGSEP
ncbi:MAG: phosphonate metabolism transcriptional regulator PhnF [Pseudomonadota bacterium]